MNTALLLLFLYVGAALSISFLCSILEATLLSTRVIELVARKTKGDRGAARLLDLKQNRIDEAHTVSTQAKEDTENDVLIKNWEHLANGRVKHFSNAGLGDEWYALGLEDPKVTVKRQRVGGKRRF